MSNAPKKRPDFFPPRVAFGPDDDNRSRLDETITNVATAGKALFSFLTADSDESFAAQLDEKHGTRIVDTMKRYGMGKDVIAASAPIDECMQNARSSTPESVQNARKTSDAYDEDDAVIIVDMPIEQECSFCHGKPVAVQNAAGAKIAIACPTCNAPPKPLRTRPRLPESTPPRGAR